MASDLEASLIDGGIPASAAKVLSNAIENAATGRLSISRQLEDVTPKNSMRRIDADSRRYLFTNLDQPKDNPFRETVNNRGDRLDPRTNPHTYDGSQPASANPTLATPTVKSGNFIQSENTHTDDVSQAKVGLDTDEKGGLHARLNPATGKVENVPISVDIQPKGILEAKVVEEEGQTVIKITIVNDALTQFLDWKWGRTSAISGNYLYVEGIAVQPYEAAVLIPR